MAKEATNRGCGCSLLGCFGGCVGTLALLGILLFVGILFLPDIAARGAEYVLQEHTARPMDMPPLLRDEATLARLHEKIGLFLDSVRDGKGRELTLALTEGEINAWLAEEIAGKKGRLPVPLHNAHVTLLKDELLLRAVLRGAEVQRLAPESSPAVFRRLLGRMNYVNLALRLQLGVRSGRLHFQIRQASLGALPVPLNAARSVAETFRPDRSVQIRLAGFGLTDVQVQADRLLLTGLAQVEEN